VFALKVRKREIDKTLVSEPGAVKKTTTFRRDLGKKPSRRGKKEKRRSPKGGGDNGPPPWGGSCH